MINETEKDVTKAGAGGALGARRTVNRRDHVGVRVRSGTTPAREGCGLTEEEVCEAMGYIVKYGPGLLVESDNEASSRPSGSLGVSELIVMPSLQIGW